MTSDPQRKHGKPDADGDEDVTEAEIEVTGYVAVDADAPPPSADDESDVHDLSEAGVVEAGGGTDGDEGEEDPAVRMTEMQNEILRVRADFENFRKRQEREKSEILRHASARLVEQLLPVVDNFKRAMSSGTDEEALAGFREGIDMIYRQMMDILANEGLEVIQTCGEVFDPNVHEAVAREESETLAANTITAEMEPGYMFRKRLLKPARVCVAVPPAEES